MKIRITKQFHFEAAHALHNYDGKCRNLHGHSYKLLVTVRGEPICDTENPKLGMVLDFGDLKKIVQKIIIDKYDHGVVFNKHFPPKQDFTDKSLYGNIIFTPYQPTCENMVADFALGIKTHLPAHIELVSIRLFETASSYAEWFASDNE
jgi:6-pyruvoyltetrahydropterin/6-carboxytetrahydropterin synthase